APLPPSAVEHLPDDPATLKCLILELLASLQERDRDNEALRHRLDLLLQRLYGPRGERSDPHQLLLFAERAAGADATAAAPAACRCPRQPPSSTERRPRRSSPCQHPPQKPSPRRPLLFHRRR